MNYNEIYGGNVESDMLVYMGGELKSLDNDGRFGGYGVLHTTAKDADLTGEFFSVKSDLDLQDGDKRSLYYSHGFDPKIQNNRIGVATFKRDDIGLWVDAQLDARSEYSSAVMDLISKQALGFSSGAVGHLVRRESVGKNKSVAHITHWPVGEISITPVPAEPRTLAIPLKMWAKSLDLAPQTEEETSAAPETKAAVSIATVRQFEEFLRDAGYSNKQAMVLASHGFKGLLRDAAEPENHSDTYRADVLRELARTELSRARELGVMIG